MSKYSRWEKRKEANNFINIHLHDYRVNGRRNDLLYTINRYYNLLLFEHFAY